MDKKICNCKYRIARLLTDSNLNYRTVLLSYYAVKCIHEMNKIFQADIPIAETIYGILYENNNVSSEMKRIAEYYI